MGGLDVERLVERLLRGEGGGARAEWLREEELAELCLRSRELLMSESALVEVGSPAVPGLIAALADDSSRSAAAEALAAIGPPAVDAKAVPGLIDALADDSSRTAAAEAHRRRSG